MRALLLLPLLLATAVAQPAPEADPPDPLAAVADALGGRDRIGALSTLRLRTRTRATLGAQTVVVRTTLALRLPGTARWTVRAPSGTTVTAVDGEGGTVTSGGTSRALSSASAAEVAAALWLDPLVLVARRGAVTAEALGAGLVRVDVPGRRDPLIVGLDADGRPARITTFRRRGGRRDYVEVVLRDYRAVDGVFVPHRVRQAVGGVVTGETTVEEVRLGLLLTGAPFVEEGG